MGVGGGFWEMLRPIAHNEDLGFLKGKKLAIDLSFWIVQQQTALKGQVRKPHLRILLYRTINLIAKVGALPVFVVDGDPPPSKLQTRLERFSRISGIPIKVVGEGDESYNHGRNSAFTQSVEECVELIRLLGIPVLRAKYEAEGLCAEMDREGFVDACVTPDSDAFLYGAKCVLKNLQVDFKKPIVELYTSCDVQSMFGLEREHLIALALLVGCDYNTQGVAGIGCHNAVRLLQAIPKHHVLNWLRKQCHHSSENELKNATNLRAEKCYHCSHCGHPGTKKVHFQNGCKECATCADEGDENRPCKRKTAGFKCSCMVCKEKYMKKEHMREEVWRTNICNKIAATKGFPDEHIIGIYSYLGHRNLAEGDAENLHCLLSWESPQMATLERFLAEHLHWDKYYVRKKMLPILSRYCLQERLASGKTRSAEILLGGSYTPHSIQRTKIFYSIPLYRIQWRKVAGAEEEDWLGLMRTKDKLLTEFVDDLDMDEMISSPKTEITDNDDGEELCFISDEDIDLVRNACPELVVKFNLEQEAKLQRSSKKRKKESQRSLFSDKQQQSITSFFRSKREISAVENHQMRNSKILSSFTSTLIEKAKSNIIYLDDDNDDEEESLKHKSSVSKTGGFSRTEKTETITRKSLGTEVMIENVDAIDEIGGPNNSSHNHSPPCVSEARSMKDLSSCHSVRRSLFHD